VQSVCGVTNLIPASDVPTSEPRRSIEHPMPIKPLRCGFGPITPAHGACGAAAALSCSQVALPHWRVQARVGLDQGFPPAPAGPRNTPPLHRSVPSPRRRRARVRTPQERVELDPASVRGLDRVRLHADLTILAKLACAQPSASRTPRRLASQPLRSADMARNHRPAIEFEDDERNSLHVTWSRTGRAILSTGGSGRGQIVLTQAQVEELTRFLAAGPEPR
jgi:hypothetical protein